MSAQPVPRLTPERYLDIERASDIRHEYFRGYMWAMSGGSLTHARITSNILAGLHGRLREGRCEVVASDLRLRVETGGLYTYPDILVYCDGANLADDRSDTILNPTVLVEVLSKSTEAYDRGLKSAQYRKIETLREYALVSQWEPRIEMFRRGESNRWHLTEVTGMANLCEFPSIQCGIPLLEIYERIVFEEFDPRPEAD